MIILEFLYSKFAVLRKNGIFNLPDRAGNDNNFSLSANLATCNGWNDFLSDSMF